MEQIVHDIRRRVESRLSARPALNGGSQDWDIALFNEQEYLAMNPDVERAVHAGVFSTGHDHWVSRGKLEGRPGRRALPDCVNVVRAELASARALVLQMGQLPPSPPTLQGRVGRVVIKVLARLMRWYTTQLQDVQIASLSIWQTQADLNDLMARVSPDLADQVQKLEMELAALRAQHRIEIDSLHVRQDEWEAQAHELRGAFQNSASESARLESGFAAITKRMDEGNASQEELRRGVNQQIIAEREVAGQTLQRLQSRLDDEAMARKGMANEIQSALRRVEKLIANDLYAAQKDLASLEKRFGFEARTRKDWTAQISAAVETIERQLVADRRAAREVVDHLQLCLDAEIKVREKLEFRSNSDITRLDQAIANRKSAHEEFSAGIMRLEGALTSNRQKCVEDVRRLRECLDAEIAAREQIAAEIERKELAIDHNLDALYVAFENTFRGTRSDIKNRQRVYLPYLQNADVGSPGMPVLDIGCGRGEWLELLRENSLHARGVDRNRTMVGLCREFGLEVEEKDALEYLRSLPNATLGAITASHVIEHIPFLSKAVGVIDEALRVLKPGGLLILETPNPQNVQVGAHTFYLDPTHRNPVPATMLKFFVEARGFTAVEVLPLHPYPECDRVADAESELASRFNDHFYGAQDYAVIGRKSV
ncbi:MAG TPA: methyltransferase domain-containing protein [Bryobacteraceae bacterium]|nr:methyltransferase domain-containing protein [Bryobacteraceae bacterium]